MDKVIFLLTDLVISIENIDNYWYNKVGAVK